MRDQFFFGKHSGFTRSQLRYGAHAHDRWRRIVGDVYRFGASPPTPLDVALAIALQCGGIVSDVLAGVLLGLDSVVLTETCKVATALGPARPRVRRRHIGPERVIDVKGFACTDGLQTLIDLAAVLTDITWEHALEAALRLRHVTIAAIEGALLTLQDSRVPGTPRIRRVLALRPAGAPATESLLETITVQLLRTIPDLRPPDRQVVVLWDAMGRATVRVDLAWPELGLFIELDGQQHIGQPVYDARREKLVIQETGWTPIRLTWTEVVDHPVATRRLLDRVIANRRHALLPR